MKKFKYVLHTVVAIVIASLTVACSKDDELEDKKVADNTGFVVINGHNFVDLGLPSGILWAETNIGALSAADDGDYFAWGETVTKDDYSWETYKYGTSSNITKYNESDGKEVLELEDDAAYVNWGNPCYMPTKEEFEELSNTDNCTWTLTRKTAPDGSVIYGYKITSNTNGNSLFLPATGSYDYGGFTYHDTDGRYWTSTLGNKYGVGEAYKLEFGNVGHGVDDMDGRRYQGNPIRPIAVP